ncbi:hypothetical protein NQ314_001210 [Rhamnusium bicolor]|uniref:DUF4371 domain-containing protein n=1 Tax=Rhamnusium bicolor TaxID=1586634 RepID=A0AAV8ZVW5_9CUCU|nr:hypothetical protein NQ314_001210 [Rhamnusium bicolor]
MEKWLIKDNKVTKQQTDSTPDLKRKPENNIEDPCTSSSSSLKSTSKTEFEGPKVKKSKRFNKFNELWLKEPDFAGWLRKDNKNTKDGHELALCLVCSASFIAHKSDIIRHMKSERHRNKSSEIQGVQKMSEFILPINLQKNIRTAELKLTGLLAEHNVPLRFIDTLGALCTNIFPDSTIAKGINLHRTKATTILKNVLGNSFLEDINDTLGVEGNFFSLVMDETTDQSSTIKQCCFTAIMYNNENNKVETVFLDMVEVESGTASGLHECLKDMLNKKHIPINNVVGFSSDTTNVMAGEHVSVFANLKKDIPHIALIKCSCHMINLSSSKACLKLPRTVEDLLRSLGAHFTQTRWLSLKACVDRVLEQYIPLKAYLTEAVFSDPSKTIEEMLATMNKQFTTVYLEFMSYVLTLLTDFNTMFQAETPPLYKLKPEVENLLKTLSSNYLKMAYIKICDDILKAEFKNTEHFVDLEKIYIGITATESIVNLKKDSNVPRSEITCFFRTCQAFYIELTTDICKRFDFSDHLFDLISIVNPSVAQQFEIQSLAQVFQRFPILNNFVIRQKVDDEWRAHAMLNHPQYGLNTNDYDSAENYWAKVFQFKEQCRTILVFKFKACFKLTIGITIFKRICGAEIQCIKKFKNRK